MNFKQYKTKDEEPKIVHAYLLKKDQELPRGVFLSDELKKKGHPKTGDAIVRNLKNFNDIKLVPKAQFKKEYVAVTKKEAPAEKEPSAEAPAEADKETPEGEQ